MASKTAVYYSMSCSPVFNLAYEEYLMTSAQKDTAILFLWQNERTMVIGRHQNPYKECDLTAMKKEGIELVRRLSGGGTVYHDMGNLNYTFIGASENYNVDRQMQLILGAVKTFGIPAELNERNDLVVDGKKFSGNAFYNQDPFHCHHGTLLIGADLENLTRYLAGPGYAIESKGVPSVSSKVVNLKNYYSGLTISLMQGAIIKAFNAQHSSEAPIVMVGPDLTGRFLKSAAKRYASWDWTYLKTPSFIIRKEKAFDQGFLHMELTVKSGLVEGCNITGDIALDDFGARLIGQPLAASAFCRQVNDSVKDKELMAALNAWFLSWLDVPGKTSAKNWTKK